jgi:hypothetical protein
LKIRVWRANMALKYPDTGVELFILTLHLLPRNTEFPGGCLIEVYFIPGQGLNS